MKKLLITICIICLVFVGCKSSVSEVDNVVADEDYVQAISQVGVCVTENALVVESLNSGSKVLATLKLGDTVNLVGESLNHYVCEINSLTGYVLKSQVEIAGENAPVTGETGVSENTPSEQIESYSERVYVEKEVVEKTVTTTTTTAPTVKTQTTYYTTVKGNTTVQTQASDYLISKGLSENENYYNTAKSYVSIFKDQSKIPVISGFSTPFIGKFIDITGLKNQLDSYIKEKGYTKFGIAVISDDGGNLFVVGLFS